MQLSQKLKEKIKKNLTIALVICAVIISTIATFKLADVSINSNNAMHTTALADSSNEENSSTTVRLENTATTTYIYDAADLVAFRNAVNAGNTYSGKTVYLMDDIDLSTVCSSTLGSFTPISTFAGTFDGKYHTINNLYINTSSYATLGFFRTLSAQGTVKNVNMKNIYVYNGYTADGNTGGIVGANNGKVQNCAIVSGSVIHYQTATASSYKAIRVGGIIGNHASGATISGCYNAGSVTATVSTSNSNCQSRVGGIAGSNTSGTVTNCYNKGTVTGKGYYVIIGGIVGVSQKYGSVAMTIKNCYNYGTISVSSGTRKYIGGIAGTNGVNSSYPAGTISNSYCTTATTYSYYTSMSGKSTSGRVAAATLKTYTAKLGSAFVYDVYGINSGYPVLSWQNNRAVMQLNRNQEYIKIGENLQLSVIEKDEITKIIGENYGTNNFKWTSTNEDVATVDSNGVVTGISEGYSTIYAYHESTGMYAMAIINVAKNVTNPQIETGNGFTTILKSDGTVWGVGNNSSGQLGNGTNENTKIPVQVYIDEDTTLNNIVKIAVGTDHVTALANDGKVYSWGINTCGQLGQNNTTSINYAKPVLGTDGATYLSNIVDISAGAYGTIALDKNGYSYVWGRGTTGEIGNSATTSKYLPTKTNIKNGIQVSIGDGHVGVLTSDGVVWSWGQNTSGQLGINCAQNTSYPMKTALNVTELSLGGYHVAVKKINETAYAAGAYSSGRLGTGSTANATTYVKINLPTTVTDTNKVKYLKAGIINTTILLTDGTVWETGFNLQGELGNGNTTTQTSFVQGLTKNGELENVLAIGRNNGNVAGSATAGYGLNTAVIVENGDIYTTGYNGYGQIGDNTTTNSVYYKKMGFAYLDYEDKEVEVKEDGYQIDITKLKYIYSSINVYNNEQIYSLRRNKVNIIKYNNCKNK